MIQMLRKEASSGNIDDLSHVRTEDCLADSLTKASAKPDALIKAVDTGELPKVDTHPPFRTLLKHKAYLTGWIAHNIDDARDVIYFLDIYVQQHMQVYYCNKVNYFPADIEEFDFTHYLQDTSDYASAFWTQEDRIAKRVYEMVQTAQCSLGRVSEDRRAF